MALLRIRKAEYSIAQGSADDNKKTIVSIGEVRKRRAVASSAYEKKKMRDRTEKTCYNHFVRQEAGHGAEARIIFF